MNNDNNFGLDSILIGFGGVLAIWFLATAAVNILLILIGGPLIFILYWVLGARVERQIEEGAERYRKEMIRKSVDRSLRRAGIPKKTTR